MLIQHLVSHWESLLVQHLTSHWESLLVQHLTFHWDSLLVHELKAACLASSVVSMDVPTVDLLIAQIVVSFLIRRLPRAVSKVDVTVGSMERLH